MVAIPAHTHDFTIPTATADDIRNGTGGDVAVLPAELRTVLNEDLATKQPIDASLTAFAALTTAADKGLYFTGADTPATYDLTAFARTVLDDASAGAARSTLVSTTHVATRTALKALTTSQDTVAFLRESGREGEFRWNSADLSSLMVIQTVTPVTIDDSANTFSMRSVTTTSVDSGTDTFTINSHGFTDGTRVTTTTTVNNVVTGSDYFIYNSTANTFQVRTSSTAAAHDLTGTTNQVWRGFHELVTGDAVTPTSTANGFTAGTLYYVIRTNECVFQLATSAENAAAGTAINFTGTTAMTFKHIADPNEARYVAPSDLTGAAGAWVRQSPHVNICHAGAVAGAESWYAIQASVRLGAWLKFPVYVPGASSAYTTSYSIRHLTHGKLVPSSDGVRKPGNGLTILGDGRELSRIKASSTFPATTHILYLDGNMNSVAALTGSSTPYAQGDNVIRGIGLEGRGAATGTACKGLGYRACWGFHIDDFEIINVSGDAMELISGAGSATGDDDVDTSANLYWNRVRLAQGGASGIKWRQARPSKIHLENFEISDFEDNGIEGGPINSKLVNGLVSGCGNRTTTTTGGIRLYNALTATGSSSICRDLTIEAVTLENNFNHELNPAQIIGLTVIGGAYNPYPQTGGAVSSKAVIRVGNAATNLTFIGGRQSTYSTVDGDFIGIDTTSGATDINVINMQFAHATSHFALQTGVRVNIIGQSGLAIATSGSAPSECFYNGKTIGTTLGPPLFYTAAPSAKTTSATLTGADVADGWITANQGGGATATYTLPLGSTLETALGTRHPMLAVGQTFDFYVINISTNAAEDVTLATNTGWTLVGEMTVESNDNDRANDSGHFRIRRTAAETFTIYRVA